MGFCMNFSLLPKPFIPRLPRELRSWQRWTSPETRLPQDGNLNVQLEKRSFEIRVSTFPTIYGENVVLRLLDQTSSLMKLEDLGFSEEMFSQYKTTDSKAKRHSPCHRSDRKREDHDSLCLAESNQFNGEEHHYD